MDSAVGKRQSRGLGLPAGRLGRMNGDAAVFALAIALRPDTRNSRQRQVNYPALPGRHGLECERLPLRDDLLRSHLREQRQLRLSMLPITVGIQDYRSDPGPLTGAKGLVDQVFDPVEESGRV